MNMKSFAKEFGKKLYEEFTVAITNKGNRTCKFTEHGLFTKSCGVFIEDNRLLRDIISGKAIIKNEWKPKTDDKYYTVVFTAKSDPEVLEDVWDNTEADYMMFMCGNVFRTKELAEKNKENIRDSFIKFYDTHKCLDWENIKE